MKAKIVKGKIPKHTHSPWLLLLCAYIVLILFGYLMVWFFPFFFFFPFFLLLLFIHSRPRPPFWVGLQRVMPSWPQRPDRKEILSRATIFIGPVVFFLFSFLSCENEMFWKGGGGRLGSVRHPFPRNQNERRRKRLTSSEGREEKEKSIKHGEWNQKKRSDTGIL